eukprot:XP_006247127.1 PREDICTED: uncharacterized protein C17orf67 homolog isoform X1 [Rattus norvegicus]
MMEKLFVLVFALTLLAFSSEASPILTEKQAKQLLRSRRQDRPSKPGFPDEPMRVSTWPWQFYRACYLPNEPSFRAGHRWLWMEFSITDSLLEMLALPTYLTQT